MIVIDVNVYSLCVVILRVIMIHRCIDELQKISHDAVLDIFDKNRDTYTIYANIFSKIVSY